MLEAVLRSMAWLMRRPELRVEGWNREIEVFGPVLEEVSLIVSTKGYLIANVPFVKARRLIELACRNAETRLTRTERAASCVMEFMMIFNGIDDGWWSFGCRDNCCTWRRRRRPGKGGGTGEGGDPGARVNQHICTDKITDVIICIQRLEIGLEKLAYINSVPNLFSDKL
jgi:hypothetical protein